MTDIIAVFLIAVPLGAGIGLAVGVVMAWIERRKK